MWRADWSNQTRSVKVVHIWDQAAQEEHLAFETKDMRFDWSKRKGNWVDLDSNIAGKFGL